MASRRRSSSVRPHALVHTCTRHTHPAHTCCAGFDKAVEECKYRMSRYGVTPNMLVLPPQMLLYMARRAPPQTTQLLLVHTRIETHRHHTHARRRSRRSRSSRTRREALRPRRALRRGLQASKLAPSAAAASSPAVPRARLLQTGTRGYAFVVLTHFLVRVRRAVRGVG